jgi:hypothetical protein
MHAQSLIALVFRPLLAWAPAQAAEKGAPLVIGETFTLQSKDFLHAAGLAFRAVFRP